MARLSEGVEGVERQLASCRRSPAGLWDGKESWDCPSHDGDSWSKLLTHQGCGRWKRRG